MPETLSTHSHVVLFGKLVEDLEVKEEDKEEKKSRTRSDSKARGFARIYGYSFSGAYYEMASPVLFLVHGNGNHVKNADGPGPWLKDEDPFYETLKIWTYDQSEQTMRLDMAAGTFEQVLLADSGDGSAGVSGARVSGARVSGARVSGARISGARLSGARGDASD